MFTFIIYSVFVIYTVCNTPESNTWCPCIKHCSQNMCFTSLKDDVIVVTIQRTRWLTLWLEKPTKTILESKSQPLTKSVHESNSWILFTTGCTGTRGNILRNCLYGLLVVSWRFAACRARPSSRRTSSTSANSCWTFDSAHQLPDLALSIFWSLFHEDSKGTPSPTGVYIWQVTSASG